jgi:integrase
MKLTAKLTAGLKLPAGKSDHIVFDDAIPGFGLRLRDTGSRTWIYQYAIGPKQRRLVIGKASAVTAEKARGHAADLHARVRLGNDPAADKAVSRHQAANNFGELSRRYLEFQKESLRPRSYAEVKRHLEANAKPLHGLPVASIDQRTIADRLNVVAKQSGAVTANRTRASLSAMFGWAMREGIALSNPVMNTGKREEKSRDRVLSDTELVTIWDALEDDHYGAIIKLLMLTGQRANEIAGFQKPEIDFDRDLITLPAERTKNGRVHQLPMSRTVREILQAQVKTDDRNFVFGYGVGPFSGWSKSKQKLDERIAATKAMPHWTPHDLRRTVATRMADIGIQPHIIEAVLNHVSGHKGGIAGIYNRALYTAEKAQALARWNEHVSALIAKRASNVTPLKRA